MKAEEKEERREDRKERFYDFLTDCVVEVERRIKRNNSLKTERASLVIG